MENSMLVYVKHCSGLWEKVLCHWYQMHINIHHYAMGYAIVSLQKPSGTEQTTSKEVWYV